MKQLLFSIGFVLIIFCCKAQHVYWMNINIPEIDSSAPCKALLVRYEDSTGFMRTTWKNSKTNENIILDWDLIKYAEKRFNYPFTHTDYYYCRAEPRKVIKGKYRVNVDFVDVWLKMDSLVSFDVVPATGTVPFQIINSEVEDYWYEVNVFNPEKDTLPKSFRGLPSSIESYISSESKTISTKQLTGYFTDWEFGAAKTFSAIGLNTLHVKIKPKLYCITLFDSFDPKIAGSCEVDAYKTKNFFSKVAFFLDISFIPIELTNKKYSVQSLYKTLNRIKTSKNDIVIFAYSGHGFSYRNDDKFPFPQLALWEGDAKTKAQLRDNSINLEAVFNILQKKNARLNIVLGDCCNSFVEMSRYEDQEEINFMQYFARWNKSTAVKLFLEAEQSFVVAATKKGQLAGSRRGWGGFFTFNLLNEISQTLLTRKLENPQWADIWNSTRSSAGGMSSRYTCEGKTCNQTLIYKSVEKVKGRTIIRSEKDNE